VDPGIATRSNRIATSLQHRPHILFAKAAVDPLYGSKLTFVKDVTGVQSGFVATGCPLALIRTL
jgi:hypothetical protein